MLVCLALCSYCFCTYFLFVSFAGGIRPSGADAHLGAPRDITLWQNQYNIKIGKLLFQKVLSGYELPFVQPGSSKSALKLLRWHKSIYKEGPRPQGIRPNRVRICWPKVSQNGTSKRDSKKWLGGSIGPPFRELLVTIWETFSDQREKVKPVLSLQSEPSREGSGGSFVLPFFVLESGPLPRPPPETIFTDFDLILASRMAPKILKKCEKTSPRGLGCSRVHLGLKKWHMGGSVASKTVLKRFSGL